jgi:hypothetical protein
MTRSRSNCPDKTPYGRFRLDMNTRLDLTGPVRGDRCVARRVLLRRFSEKMWRGCRDRPGGSVPGPDAATVAAPHQGDPA